MMDRAPHDMRPAGGPSLLRNPDRRRGDPFEREPSRVRDSAFGHPSLAAVTFFAIAMAVLVVLGVASEARSARTTHAFRRALEVPRELRALVAVTAEVGRRFEEIREGRFPSRPVAWLGRSASRLESGGVCGDAAVALGAVFDQAGQPFRILQLNVGPTGAAHVVVEAVDSDGRWILLDPLMSRAISDRRTGRPLTLDEARGLGAEAQVALPPEYVDGAFSLFAPFRRTNWSRLGPLARPLEWLVGRPRFDEISLRAILIEPGGEMAMLAGIGLAALAFEVARRRRLGALSGGAGRGENPRESPPAGGAA